MTLSPPLLHAANVSARSLIPVIGVVFLGWSGGKVLLIYFADTLASMYVISSLGGYATMQSEPGFQASVKDGIALGRRLSIGIRVALMGLILPAMLAIPFGGILAILLAVQDFWWGEALYDRNLWIGIACQFLGAVALMMPQLAWIKTLKNPVKLVRARTALLFARWIALLFVGMNAVLLPEKIYFALLVLAYAAATIALELAPERVLMAINASDLSDATTPRDAGALATAATPPSHDAACKSLLRHFRRRSRQ